MKVTLQEMDFIFWDVTILGISSSLFESRGEQVMARFEKKASEAADESQKQKRGHSGSTEREETTVNSTTLMEKFHLMNSELEPQVWTYKGRVVRRYDWVKDDSGSYEVFTEQGLFASQMTAAKVMDVIASQPGYAEQDKQQTQYQLVRWMGYSRQVGV